MNKKDCSSENCNTFGKYISQLYRQGNSFLGKEFNKFGIGSGQYMFLIHLYRNDGVSQETLSEIINIDKGTTAKAIKKLEDLGFVFRVKDLSDKRSNKIYLTLTALDIKDDFFNILNQWNELLNNGLTEEEIILGHGILEKMTRNLNIKDN